MNSQYTKYQCCHAVEQFSVRLWQRYTNRDFFPKIMDVGFGL